MFVIQVIFLPVFQWKTLIIRRIHVGGWEVSLSVIEKNPSRKHAYMYISLTPLNPTFI